MREREREGHFGQFIRKKGEKWRSGVGRIIFQTSGEVTVIFQTSGVLCVLKANLRGGQCNLPIKKMSHHQFINHILKIFFENFYRYFPV